MHDADILYAAGNVLFRTTDEGQTWQAISPDLTRNEKSRQQSSGGPITKDNTSVEYFGTIFAVAESRQEAGVIWAGSDDGLLHLTRDGGATWTDVTPRGLPRDAQVNSIEAHPFEPGGLYLAATAYKLDDFRPYLFVTTDYGRNWKAIVRGIPEDEFTRVIRADAERPGLLYAGTERGVWYSTDDGAHWRRLQLNLPIVPITDLAIRDGHLAAATQGRGYWMFDDLGLLRQASDEHFADTPWLFTPAPALRLPNRSSDEPGHQGRNPAAGAVLHYWLPEELPPETPLELAIVDRNGETVRTFTRKPEQADEEKEPAKGDDDRLLTATAGLNRIEWNLRYPGVERFRCRCQK